MSSQPERDSLLLEIQSDLGKALWQIQAFEDTLAHLIAIVLEMPANASIAEAVAILDDVRKGTLGKLIRRAREAVHFDETFELTIARFVDERNWLVHRSWRMYHHVFFEPNVYRSFRLRTRGVARDALELNKLFAGLIEDWAKNQGVGEARLRELEEEFTNVWHKET